MVSAYLVYYNKYVDQTARMHVGWSVHFLFTYENNKFSHDVAQLKTDTTLSSLRGHFQGSVHAQNMYRSR